MNRSMFAIVALAGIASSAAAADFMKLDVQVSTDGNAWSDTVAVNPGAAVLVRFVVSFDRTAGWDAWGGTTLTQLNVTGSDAGDTATGFGGRTQPQSQTFDLFGAGTASGKIDRKDNTAGSIQMAQLPTNNGGVKDNPIVVFSFTYNVSNNGAHGDVTLDAASTNITLATLFTTGGGTSVQIAAAGRSVDGATITMVPAPGALAVGGLAGLAGLRRRRA